jgi:hypothetical protein
MIYVGGAVNACSIVLKSTVYMLESTSVQSGGECQKHETNPLLRVHHDECHTDAAQKNSGKSIDYSHLLPPTIDLFYETT